MTSLVLASASPARRMLLSNAGVTPVIKVSQVDEESLAQSLAPIAPIDLCLALAKAKARDVAQQFSAADDVIVLGCDSVLDVDGVAHGKPGSADAARERWKQMAGRSGFLRTGHWLIQPSTGLELGDVASSEVFHATPSAIEIEAYIATGEPLQVAGGFTLDALGGPFIERIIGDPSNVVGLSLPLLRLLLQQFSVTWTDLWVSPKQDGTTQD
ncbi:MAG: nucleoside triphosphate pyrophosphatase [Actinomycetota bacterium]|nr:nucleoside triphosphate pyrophosphatase [Actinomycetota bacterium]